MDSCWPLGLGLDDPFGELLKDPQQALVLPGPQLIHLHQRVVFIASHTPKTNAQSVTLPAQRRKSSALNSVLATCPGCPQRGMIQVGPAPLTGGA